MIIERLKNEEFSELKKVEDGFCPDPEQSIAVVAKDGNEIVGRMLLLSLAHIEGTWIDPSRRNGTIAVRMIKEMEKQAKDVGLTKIFAYSGNDEISKYMERLGYKRSALVVFEKEI